MGDRQHKSRLCPESGRAPGKRWASGGQASGKRQASRGPKGAPMIPIFKDHPRDQELFHVQQGTVPDQNVHTSCLVSHATVSMHMSGNCVFSD